MFIQTETTPNPQTLKFIPGQVVLADGTAEFKSGESLAESPLAQKLFEVSGVTSAFFSRDFISVSIEAGSDWALLKPQVIGAIMDHFTSGLPVVNRTTAPSAHGVADDEIGRQIIEIIEQRVRPAVAQDGGDIVFDRFENGIVYLHMRGACAGCPSSLMTLKNGIENMLRHFVPEVNEVRAVQDSSAE